ncbi:TraR/DksA family transcriptional regulator [Aliidiomarina indica]|uniref:TraR/DksA family transcriptional regulator n=1 Tax=Aliidiomarina indica TaxID=2749147 RepID=UPI00188E6027|nr:TraR/DksA family transcriptional regulator [Aliidiomarina indica]
MVDLEHYKTKLLELRSELQALGEDAAESQQPVTLDQQSVGRLSRMDAMQNQEMAQANQRRRELLLQRITAALVRIEDDEYGYCEACGEAIAEARLEIDPVATLCIDCQSEREAR